MIEYMQKAMSDKRAVLYFLLLAISIFWSSSLLFFIFIFPAIFLFKINRKNFLITIPFALISNNFLFILVSSILDSFGVGINQGSIIAAFFLIGLVLFLNSKVRNKLGSINFKGEQNRAVYAIYALFGLAIIVRVVSVMWVDAPILHDPMAHAYWAKQIINKQQIDSFYSPGLHILIGFVAKSLDTTYALATHHLSNFLNAFSVLSWGLGVYIITKNRLFGVLTSILMFLAPYPGLLYLLSGKNALIAALAYMPLVFILTEKFISRFSLSTYFGFLFGFLGLFLVHYPIFGIYFIFVSVLSLTAIIKKRGDDLKRALLYLASAFVILVMTTSVWILTHNNQLDTTGGSNQILSSNIIDSGISISLDEVKEDMISTYQEFKKTADGFSTYFFPLMIASIGFLILIAQSDRYARALLIWAASIPFASFLISLLDIKSLGIIRPTGVLLLFQIFALTLAYASSFLLLKIRHPKWLSYTMTVVISISLLILARAEYKKFDSRTEAFTVVNDYDLQAFDWINKNLSKEAGFIVSSSAGKNRKNIIYPTDGGLWIPVYTENPVSVSFLEFASSNSYQNNDMYTNLINGVDSEKSLGTLRERGFNYYYFDRAVFGPSWVPVRTPGINVKPIYSNPEVIIYELIRN